GLSNLRHVDGSLHAAVNVQLAQEVLQSQAVHDRAEHAHVVRTGTIHATLGKFCTTEEVTAADDHCHLGAGTSNFCDLTSYIFYYIRINADLPTAEHFTA